MSDMVQTLGSILKNGGTQAAYKRVTAAGADLGTPDTWHNAVYRIDSDLGFEQPVEKIELEDGNIGGIGAGQYDFNIVVTSAQLDAALINFFNQQSLLNEFFAMFFDCGFGADGARLEIFVALGKFTRSLKWTGKARQPVWTYNAIVNPAAVTPATLPSWAVGDAGDFAVPAKDHFIAADSVAA